MEVPEYSWMIFVQEHPNLKMDDLGVPPFMETAKKVVIKPAGNPGTGWFALGSHHLVLGDVPVPCLVAGCYLQFVGNCWSLFWRIFWRFLVFFFGPCFGTPWTPVPPWPCAPGTSRISPWFLITVYLHVVGAELIGILSINTSFQINQ